MKTAVLAITRGGRERASQLATSLEQARVFFCRGRLKATVRELWPETEAFIFFMASGIVVRTIAPLLGDKTTDPAVVVCDEKGRFAISLVSGHLGRANELAETVAGILGGEPVITTASDVLGHTPLDIWARELELEVTDRARLTRAMGILVNSGKVTLYSEYPIPDLPDDIRQTSEPAGADLVITCRTDLKTRGALLHPKALVAGIGCNRHTPADHIARALEDTLRRHGLAPASIRNLASIDVKAGEPGLIQFARQNGYEIDFFGRDELNGVQNVSVSAAALKAVGARGVAEPAALLSARGKRLLVRKTKCTDVTIAIAEVASPWQASALELPTS